MPSVQAGVRNGREQLERVLDSIAFARTEQLSRLMRFLVERHLDGRDDELKESVIGVEVFQRKPDYNPKHDPIVRTEARRLRARLSKYYEGEGKTDTLVIELPKGGYLPVLRHNPALIGGAKSAPTVRPRWPWLALALGCLVVALTTVAWTRFEQRNAGTPNAVPSKINAKAYALFLRARAFEVQSGLRGIEDSIDLFDQAIATDQSFAAAYAGLAEGHAARSGFDGLSPVERADVIAKGWAAARKSIELDPRLADAHNALGMMQARAAQWEPAEASFQRAVELAPDDPLWRNRFATFLLLPLGRIEDALGQLRIAQRLDPLSSLTHYALSMALRAAGRFDDAEAHCQKVAENDRQRSTCWAETFLRQGNAEQAIRILETMWNGHLLEGGKALLGVAYTRAGRREDAERIAALLPRPLEKAQIFAALGDKDRTFEALDRMAPLGPIRIGRDVLIRPEFALLRGDPRLKALRRKVGLPDSKWK